MRISALNIFGRIWRELSGVRMLTVGIAAAGCLTTCASLFFVWVTKRIVDFAVAPEHEIPAYIILCLFIALFVQLVTPAVRRKMEITAFTRYSVGMRSRLLNHILCRKWTGKGDMAEGDAVSRINDDVAELAGFSCITVPGAVSVVLQLAGAFIFLAFLDVRLALAVVFIMPVALLVSKIYLKKTRRLTREIRSCEGSLQSFLQESIRHRTLISTLMGIGRQTLRYGRLQGELTEKVMRRVDISLFSNAAVTAGFMAGYAVAFLWSAYGLAAGTVSFGMMTALMQLVAQVQRPVVDFSRRIPAFVAACVALERIDEIFSLPLESSSAKPFPEDSVPGIRLTDVSYRYPDSEEDVIRNFSYDFRPGSITSVTGVTGAGKSTLLRILLGLVTPTSGTAGMYDSDGESGTIEPGMRRGIVYVPQGNSLMRGTVRENLLLADSDATEKDMTDALCVACAEFVLTLPKGLDTECSEGGGGFSEGQAQRIAIARGLLKKGNLILLDEPTSALDNETERRLLGNLSSRLKGNSTVIIVTHRKAALEFSTATVELSEMKESK